MMIWTIVFWMLTYDPSGVHDLVITDSSNLGGTLIITPMPRSTNYYKTYWCFDSGEVRIGTLRRAGLLSFDETWDWNRPKNTTSWIHDWRYHNGRLIVNRGIWTLKKRK